MSSQVHKFISDRKELQPILARLKEFGFPEIHLEAWEGLLTLQLSREASDRLLADQGLREQIILVGKSFRFSRIALELSSGNSRRRSSAR